VSQQPVSEQSQPPAGAANVFERFRLHGRRAVVTGGSRGLGLAMARALAEAGADLVLLGREPATLARAAADLQRPGQRVDTLAGDVGIPAEAIGLMQKVVNDFSPIDILINNVGGRRMNVATEDVRLEDWQRIIDLNLTSALICSQIVGRGMIQRRRGVVINVTSIAASVVIQGIYGRAYETSKAALQALTRSLALDWAAYNVRVNAIAPGVFLTDPNRKWFAENPALRDSFIGKIPMARPGQPDEIGPLALYLASDASSYVTGSVFVIDGGYTLW
jgi:NAD(P)-dependent dehydrogenase (short-subunit alcohol dehydrogenase family)